MALPPASTKRQSINHQPADRREQQYREPAALIFGITYPSGVVMMRVDAGLEKIIRRRLFRTVLDNLQSGWLELWIWSMSMAAILYDRPTTPSSLRRHDHRIRLLMIPVWRSSTRNQAAKQDHQQIDNFRLALNLEETLLGKY